MTTSLVYPAYGSSDVEHKSTKYLEGQVVIAAEMSHNSIYKMNGMRNEADLLLDLFKINGYSRFLQQFNFRGRHYARNA